MGNASPTPTPPASGSPPASHPMHDRLIAAVETSVERLAALSADELQAAQCTDELSRLETVVRRVKARQTQLIGAINRHERAVARARRHERDEHGRHLDDTRADRGVQDQLVNELNWTPTDARKASRASWLVTAHPALGAAYAEGQITERHLEIAADTLRHVAIDTAPDLEAELLDVARATNPVDFGKHCRRLLAERHHDAAMRDEHLRRGRRSVRMTTGPDGMLHLTGRLAGIDAEAVAAAIKAFRRPDGSDVSIQDRRSPEQVTADALAELCNVALGAGAAPTRHQVRPHIVVTIDHQTLLTGTGAVTVDELGTLPFGEIRRLLADAGVSRILVDPDHVPLEAGKQVRTVPTGLWRALRIRDGGCIAAGCTLPAEWCQVAHLEQPYRFDGRLSPLNAALLCTQHHVRYDQHGWRIDWHDRRPTLHPPDRSPRRGHGPGAPHQTTSPLQADDSPRQTPPSDASARSTPLDTSPRSTPSDPTSPPDLASEARGGYRSDRPPPWSRSPEQLPTTRASRGSPVREHSGPSGRERSGPLVGECCRPPPARSNLPTRP